MSQNIIMPKLGNTVESVIILEWRKGVGDSVSIGDILCEVETDKVNVEVEAENEGILLAQLFQTGDEVPVLKPFAVLGEAGEIIPQAQSTDAVIDVGTGNSYSVPTATDTKKKNVTTVSAESPDKETTKASVRISPRARNLAVSQKIQYLSLTGTGPNGRIVERDVLNKDETLSGMDFPGPVEYFPAGNESQRINSYSPFIIQTTVAADSLLRWLEILERIPDSDELGNASVIDIMLFVTARLLPDFPTLNTKIDISANRIERYRHVHVKFPVISNGNDIHWSVLRFADTKPLSVIFTERKGLVKKSMEEQVELPDNGTFIVENWETYDIQSVVPSLHGSQAAALGVGSFVTTDRTERSLNLSLVVDSRYVVRAEAVRFFHELASNVSNLDLFIARYNG